MRYVWILISLFLLNVGSAYAQKNYVTAKDGKLTRVSTWSVDGEPATTLPTRHDDYTVLAEHETELGGVELGGVEVGESFTCGDITIAGQIDIASDDSLIVHGDLILEASNHESNGILVFRGEKDATFQTGPGFTIVRVIIIDKEGELALSKEDGYSDLEVFVTHELVVESGVLNTDRYKTRVSEMHMEGGSSISSLYPNIHGFYSLNRPDTIRSILGRIATRLPSTRIDIYVGNPAAGKKVMQEEFKGSDWYGEEKELLPLEWDIRPGKSIIWFFDATFGDSVEVYKWIQQTFIPVPQQREPDGSVSVSMEGGADSFVLVKVLTSTAAESEEIPKEFRLLPPYPNPFNPATTIPLKMASAGELELSVYDILGRRVGVLVDEFMPAGRHEVIFEANNLPSGLYIIRSNFGQSRTVTLLK